MKTSTSNRFDSCYGDISVVGHTLQIRNLAYTNIIVIRARAPPPYVRSEHDIQKSSSEIRGEGSSQHRRVRVFLAYRFIRNPLYGWAVSSALLLLMLLQVYFSLLLFFLCRSVSLLPSFFSTFSFPSCFWFVLHTWGFDLFFEYKLVCSLAYGLPLRSLRLANCMAKNQLAVYLCNAYLSLVVNDHRARLSRRHRHRCWLSFEGP